MIIADTIQQCWTLMQTNRRSEAEALSTALFEQHPNNHTVLVHHGQILLTTGKELEGLELLKQAHRQTPQPASILKQIATTAHKLGRTKDALEFYGLALEANPSAEQMAMCGNFMLEIGQLKEAEQLLALASAQGHLSGVAGLVNLRLRQGRQPEAADLVSANMQRLSESIELIHACARLLLSEKEYASAWQVLGMMPLPKVPPSAKPIHFRLRGEVFDKLGYPQEAFTSYFQFNTLLGNTYDMYKQFNHIQQIKKSYTKETDHPRSTCLSTRPVFIVGMPRSGTSLLEQILSMHPDVYGAGELDTLPALIEQHGTETTESLNQIANGYLEYLDSLDTNCRVVTDKLPHNYQYIGAISQIFPNAKVLYCKRDPLDTGWSCYRQNFHQSLNFSTDLFAIGHYQGLLMDLMEHWQKVLHTPILEVPYEQVVQDLESVASQILEFCGLTWDPQVLEFHRSKRVVNTASTVQVQQPLYTSSIGSHKRYNKWLKPLREGLNIPAYHKCE